MLLRKPQLFAATTLGHVIAFTLTFELGFLPFLSASNSSDPPASFPESSDPPASFPESKWSALDKKLFTFLNNVTGIETLQKTYDDAESSGMMTFEPVDGQLLINHIAASLGELFAKKVEALKLAVEHAEKLAADYKWNQDLEEVDYLYAKELNDSVEPFREDELYNDQIVSLENSSVHIPVDIFKGNVDILNSIAWTSGLDEVWKENKERDPSLVWQYFGSRTGVLRTYPATAWKNKTQVDLYDVRRTAWYTQGVSSPKDMLILIERSGSSHGQSLELIKISVRSILDTLGENDFVNIAHFSERAEFAGCFQSFVQATDRNKKILKSFLKDVYAQQVANYSKGFEFAFQQFAHFFNQTDQKSSEGANCNPIIMLFTDGTSDVPVDVFQKYNANKTIRIFSYAVGPMAGNRSVATKQIGCSNRGFYYPIPAMGAIRATVQEYLHLLGGDISANEVLPASWSNVFDDNLKMGLVIAVTMPVFQKSNSSGNFNQTVLGMMGVDVTLKELMDVIPTDKLGPNGYAFGLNSNGIVLFHPVLDKYRVDIAIPVIDFAEMEEETTAREQIRNEMIDQITNNVEITEFVTGFDAHHAAKKKRTYHYTAIPGTQFSVAVVLPDYVKYHVADKQHIDLETGKALLLTNDSQLLYNATKICRFADVETNETVENPSVLEKFVEYLSSNSTECDAKAVQQLLFDVYITSSLEENWIEQGRELDGLQSNETNETTDSNEIHQTTNGVPIEKSLSDGILARFVKTGKDFERVFRQENNEDEDDEEKEKLKTFVEMLHKESFDSDVWLFAFYPEEIQPASLIFATKAVSLTRNSYKAAGIGVQLTLEKFHDLIFDDDLSGCNNPDVSYCYVLDDGGFILSSNSHNFESSVGQFFGAVEGEVMKTLIDNKIFEGHMKFDYQAICSENKSRNAGFRIVPPFFYDVLSLNWWTTATTWSYLNFMNIYSWLFATQVPSVAAVEDEIEERECIKSVYQYYFGISDSLSGETGCDNCTQTFVASRLKSTNLLMVSVQSESCGCAGINIAFPDSKEIDYDPLVERPQGWKANCTARVRYRRRPPCYDTNPFEPDSYCGASSLFVISRYHITLFVTIVLNRFMLLLQRDEGC